jgi:hypothetical protein
MERTSVHDYRHPTRKAVKLGHALNGLLAHHRPLLSPDFAAHLEAEIARVRRLIEVTHQPPPIVHRIGLLSGMAGATMTMT